MIGDVTNHVWQSTVFAIVIGLMTVAFRQNRAYVRYWLWLTASLKFLLPFSLLISLVSRVDWASASHAMPPRPPIALTIVQVSQPFPESLPIASSASSTRDWIAIAIFSVWACGFAA